MLVQRDEWNSRPEVVRGKCEYGPIPAAERFYEGSGYGYKVPTEVHGWQWSSTFWRWSALVTFDNGWRGFTWPEPEAMSALRAERQSEATDAGGVAEDLQCTSS